MIDFAGWRMPVQYTSILDEHRAVRERVGLFDLSHMGEMLVEGADAAGALAAAVVSDPAALKVGRAHYSMIVAPDGGIIDDLIIYRLAEQQFMVVANAGNAQARVGRARRAARRRSSRARRPLARDRPRRRAGPPFGRRPGAAHGRRPRRAALLRDRRGRRSPGSRPGSRGPATPARTGSRCSWTPA